MEKVSKICIVVSLILLGFLAGHITASVQADKRFQEERNKVLKLKEANRDLQEKFRDRNFNPGLDG